MASCGIVKVVRSAVEEVEKGTFVRSVSVWRRWVKKSVSLAAEQEHPDQQEFPVESGRYHLYVALGCPWCARVLMMRTLKGLEDVISLSVTHPVWGRTKPDVEDDRHMGWVWNEADDFPGCIPCPEGFKTIRDVYEKAKDTHKKFTVPVLWDKKLKTIVSNESADIMRMFDTEFDALARNPNVRMYPSHLQTEIDSVAEWIYPMLNNGVYRAGFATLQKPHEEAIRDVFNALDRLELILSKQRFLVCNRFTEADIRLFVTLIRFDEVYVTHFKCNIKRIADYPNIFNYIHDVYQIPGIAKTVDMAHIKHHYYRSHPTLNPHGIVPVGPGIDYTLPHDRDRFPTDPFDE